jgi:hypothetical protein
MALKKLAVQAHGEALTQLMGAWEARDAAKVPTAQELGGVASGPIRAAWLQALSDRKLPAKAPADHANEALLRLEIAAELPTPAGFLDARRGLQLKLLTKRNDPAPAQTWGEDTAVVFASDFEAMSARRLQNVLKVLLKR